MLEIEPQASSMSDKHATHYTKMSYESEGCLTLCSTKHLPAGGSSEFIQF